MSGFKCAKWVPDDTAEILGKEFVYWRNLWAWPLRVGPPTQDTMADLLSPENKHLKEMQFWQRLANDPAMEKVYEDLDTVGFDKHRLADFLDAAWMANMGDLRGFRERRDQTFKTVPEIVKKALELKEMIESLDSDLMPPRELFDVVSLLRLAEQYQQTPWAYSWQGGVGHSALDSIDPHIWNGAPTVPNLLQALVGAATEWKQKAERGEITEDANRGNPVLTAALQKDRSLLIPEYARGFIAALRDKGFVVTSQSPMHLTRAIRGIIRVVLGHTKQDTKGEPEHQADAVRMAVSRAIAS